MLIEFSVGNYRSFKKNLSLNMVAAKLKSSQKELDENNTFQIEGGPTLLTSAAIYGANASGKSNLVRAIAFMKRFVLRSYQGTKRTGGIDVDRFRLSLATANEPSFFEIVFVQEGKRYRYGFESSAERIHSEWLYFVPTIREATLFEREEDAISIGEYFPEGRGLAGRTRPNALFLTVVAQFDGPIAQKLVSWFRNLNVASGLSDIGMRMFTIRQFLDENQSSAISAFVERLDVGISALSMQRTTTNSPPSIPEEMPEEMRNALMTLFDNASSEQVEIETTHTLFDDDGNPAGAVQLSLDEHESEGTQKLVSLAGPLLDALALGEVLIIDELDARLHPLLTREIVKLFNDPITNPHHAQLVFTTHDTNLLDHRLLRRDQIWFVEKNQIGASELYSLAEFKVRNDKVYERGYVEGRYGAVPYLGDLGTLVGVSHASSS